MIKIQHQVLYHEILGTVFRNLTFEVQTKYEILGTVFRNLSFGVQTKYEILGTVFRNLSFGVQTKYEILGTVFRNLSSGVQTKYYPSHSTCRNTTQVGDSGPKMGICTFDYHFKLKFVIWPRLSSAGSGFRPPRG